MIDHDEFSAWLRLLETPGLGREAARALLARFGAPEAVLAASTQVRAAVVGPAIERALAVAPEPFKARLAAAWQWLHAGDEPRDAIPIGEPRYPRALLQTADPPLLLYTRGAVELLQLPAIAIVGSGNPTPQGAQNARAFAAHLAGTGWAIVSGLALGIDGAAHEGALGAGGKTIAVVGTGLDIDYPPRHRGLAQRIAREGLLLSEFAIGTPPLAANFPARTRIIAGLARGTLVVEAAAQSGSLVTARLAAQAGRDVFAIPGSIDSPQSRGCHALIKQGAKLVEGASDIVEELGPLRPPPTPVRATTAKASDPLLEALGFAPVGLDELVARTGTSAAELSARLLELELQGRVARLPGQRFQRLERA
ncbi:MAG: DNA-protecting protein DprA [Rhizobacter sp.]|nr:DNA-protecting protein DprA [Rhizobacter sp.]